MLERTTKHAAAMAGAATLMAGLALPVAGQGKSDFDVAALFRSSCAPCHGLQGHGDGPVAAALKVKIKPLSTLAARHGGVFPFGYVYGVIDGRWEVKAHGTRVMPVWGNYFGRRQGTQTAAEGAVEQKIDALVGYILKMQPQ